MAENHGPVQAYVDHRGDDGGNQGNESLDGDAKPHSVDLDESPEEAWADGLQVADAACDGRPVSGEEAHDGARKVFFFIALPRGKFEYVPWRSKKAISTFFWIWKRHRAHVV